MKFVIKIDGEGNYFLNNEPIDRRGCGWWESSDGSVKYSREANIEDRLNLAVEFGEVGREKVNECKNYFERYQLWETVKEGKRISESFLTHPMYFDPADSRLGLIEKLEKKQDVNKAGTWYGCTICFIGQMFDREGNKISSRVARRVANQVGFINLKKAEIGCLFMVTDKYSENNDTNKKAINAGAGVISPEEFWTFVDEEKEHIEIDWSI